MSLKFCFIFISTIFLSVFGNAQSDSTDLNFYSTEPVLLTQEDSLMFGGGDFVQLNLEFEIEDTANFGKVWVEVNAFDFESNSKSVFYNFYTLDQMISSGFIIDGDVQLELATVNNVYGYAVVIRIEDNFGNEKISISKNLVP